jgi:hypothetical protein
MHSALVYRCILLLTLRFGWLNHVTFGGVRVQGPLGAFVATLPLFLSISFIHSPFWKIEYTYFFSRKFILSCDKPAWQDAVCLGHIRMSLDGFSARGPLARQSTNLQTSNTSFNRGPQPEFSNSSRRAPLPALQIIRSLPSEIAAIPVISSYRIHTIDEF